MYRCRKPWETRQPIQQQYTSDAANSTHLSGPELVHAGLQSSVVPSHDLFLIPKSTVPLLPLPAETIIDTRGTRDNNQIQHLDRTPINVNPWHNLLNIKMEGKTSANGDHNLQQEPWPVWLAIRHDAQVWLARVTR